MELLNDYQADISRLARIRWDAIEELRARGLSYSQIGEALELTRGRIAQIRAAGQVAEEGAVDPANALSPRPGQLIEGLT